MVIGVEFLFLLLFFVADAYFSAAETALSALSRMGARKLRDEHPELAPILTDYLENPGRLLTTVIVSSSLCIIFFSFMASAVTSQVLGSQAGIKGKILSWVVSGLASVILALVAEITPKVLAKGHAEKVGVAVLPVMARLDRFLGPLIRLLLKTINFLSRAFGGPQISQVPVMTEKELRQMLLEGEREGILEREEREMIHSVMEFGDTLVKEVMVPREEMFCLNITTGQDACLDKLISGGYSRVPVYQDSLDRIVGILYSKDYLSVLKNQDLIILKDALRPAYFVPENKKVTEILREFKHGKMHLAIVINERGAVAGLATLEDLLEEIVGEIYDEYDTPVKWIEASPDGSLILDARTSIHKVNSELELKLPERMDATTLNGWIINTFKGVPKPGEEVEFEGGRFKVLEATPRRVSKVRLEKIHARREA